MKILNVILATSLLATAPYRAGPQAPALNSWSAAKYHGLTVGTSTRVDVLRILGRPNYVGREEDTGTPIMTYVVVDPMPGTLVVYMNKGILDGMRLDLKKSLRKDDIIRLFGHDYVVVHYAADDCLDEGGSAPIYQSSSGPFKYMEYRDRGMAAGFACDDDQKVDAITFTYKPLGPTHSLCAGHSHVPPSLNRR